MDSPPGTPSSSRPVMKPLDFQRTPEEYLKPGDHVVMERTPSGELRHWRPKKIDVADDIEYIDCGQEPILYKLLQSENNLVDEVIHDAESFDNDSGSEVENDEDFNPEELRELLQESDPEEDGEPMEDFTWSDDFATFAGVREDFQEHPGAKIEGTSPSDLFTQLWDEDLMESIVVETNRYAWEYIVKTHEQEGGLTPRSRVHGWVETTVPELYRLISVIILMGMCVRSRVDEYWTTGVLGMPEFRRQLAKNRYILLIKFLHFVDNRIIESDGPHRKLAKIKPVLDHLNQKFKAAYTPRQELSVDESLLLRKGNLSWVQCIRTKAARFGIKSYQLCEAISGYVLNIIIYTGAGRDSMQALFGGRTTATAKVVLNLVKDYLEKGYTIFMDNYYNSVWLCRFLKSRHTDVVGTLNRHRKDTPADIKNLNEKKVNLGTMVSRHCGDVSVVSWKDIRLVTTVSTYHNANVVQGQRSGTEFTKPAVIHDYNKFMGGVDLKNQKLSMYLLERKRGTKWYMKVFRHLLNTSILNAYVIYTSNMNGQREKKLTHRQFRYNLAEELAQKYGEDSQSRHRSGRPSSRLNRDLDHFPVHIMVSGERTAKQVRYKRSRCVRCAALNRVTKVNIFCSQCKVCLCVGQCWKDFHTEVIL